MDMAGGWRRDENDRQRPAFTDLLGMKSGKHAVCTSFFLISLSRSVLSRSQMAMPHGLITMQPRTGLWSTRSLAYTRLLYHFE